jgi:glycosyltransferase involved in cell wall biosynthesis
MPSNQSLGLSVVIPTLNEAQVLEATICRFLPYRERFPLEVIVSDDGSDDGTREIASALADRVICNPGVPAGRSGALNRGARAARYPNLLFLDADMRIDPLESFLDEVRGSFAGDPLVGGGMIDFRVWPELETFADVLSHALWNRVMRAVLLITGRGISTPGFQMGKREVFERIGGYDERLRLTQDVDYSLRLSKAIRIHYFRSACLYESPRRYRDEGYLIYTFRSALRWWSILVRQRSFGSYTCVR